MQQLILVTAAVSMVISCVGMTSAQEEPLCQNKACGEGEVCRVVETCESPDVCSLETACLNVNDSRMLRGGCLVGQPLLTTNDSGAYELRSCFTASNCRDGFYCSTVLQDVESRCCRAAPASVKAGSCPAVAVWETHFCVDECLSDADCAWNYKCCPKSSSCSRSYCIPPDPCSLTTCPEGMSCIVSPDFTAHCLPSIPPMELAGPPSPPPLPINSENESGAVAANNLVDTASPSPP